MATGRVVRERGVFSPSVERRAWREEEEELLPGVERALAPAEWMQPLLAEAHLRTSRGVVEAVDGRVVGRRLASFAVAGLASGLMLVRGFVT